MSDIDAYFTRIHYAGPRTPSFEALCGIVAGHARAIPFENVDVLLRRPVDVDFPALVDKLVHRRRGGYCFEHNGLLLGVLRTLGFDVTGLGARVLWRRTDETPGPRTHMVLRVTLPDGDRIVDVGFGGLTLTAPLRFVVGPEQATPHEPHRLVARGDETELQARLGGEWMPLYHFSMQPCLAIDYELANWFTSTHPRSPFLGNLLAARPDPDRRYALLNDQFTIHLADGRSDKRCLADSGELGDVLARHFRLDLPEADVATAWNMMRR